MTRFVFVGERPSPRAEQIGATWENGHLAAKTLHDALRAAGLEPSEHRYLNLWTSSTPNSADARHEKKVVRRLVDFQRQGYQVVAMGELVARALRARGLWHVQIVHPAARGKIRKREVYQQHVRERLVEEVACPTS